MRTPQAFLSSTLVGLKYVRASVNEFLKVHGWHSVVFEENSISWKPGQKIDQSCIKGVDACEILILVLGQHYGRSEADYSRYHKLISITEAEYLRAVEKNLYIYSFVERVVHEDYRLWQQNGFNKEFRSSTDMRCLELLKCLKADRHQYPVISFEHIEEILAFLTKQWANILAGFFINTTKEVETSLLDQQIEKLELATNKLDRLYNHAISEGNDDEIVSKLTADSDSVKRQSVIQKFKRSSIVKYIERHAELPDIDVLIALVEENKELKVFLKAINLPQNSADYVLDYAGSHATYDEIRQALISEGG